MIMKNKNCSLLELFYAIEGGCLVSSRKSKKSQLLYKAEIFYLVFNLDKLQDYWTINLVTAF